MLRQNYKSKRRATATLLTLLLRGCAMPTPALAAEPVSEFVSLPAGTAVQRPGANPIIVTAEPRWLVTRSVLQKAIVQAADLQACREEVKACEARSVAPATAGFFSTTAGKIGIGVIGGLVFAGGFYVGHAL